MNPNSSDINTNDSLAEKVSVGLTKVGLALKSQSWQEAGPLGISPTQGHILRLLQEHTQSDGMRLGAIAQALAVTPATASDAVRVLAEKGLVQKGRAADDKRAIAIRLTSAGQEQATAVADRANFLRAAVNTLSPEEQTVFLQGLIKIIGTFQEQGKISVARMCTTCQYFRPDAHNDARYPHHCAFIDAAIGNEDLQIDCPDHLAKDSA